MGELPVVSGKEAARAFEKAGWVFDRQTGSHMIFKKSGERLRLSIPNHAALDRGLLRRLIRDSGMSVDEYVALL
jgi:predicted RNA binding protein YcfA (HicA-like mRNA interferase family)